VHHIPMIEHKDEDLLDSPERTLKPVWGFLGVGPCDGILDFHRQEAQQQAAAASYMWTNLAKPLQVDNREKFYSGLGRTHTLAVERVIGEGGLAEFGYAPASPDRFPPPAADTADLPPKHRRTAEDEEFQRRQKEVRSRLRERSDAVRKGRGPRRRA
jgi:hypothetical protein